jgi:hypothetical protein
MTAALLTVIAGAGACDGDDGDGDGDDGGFADRLRRAGACDGAGDGDRGMQ